MDKDIDNIVNSKEFEDFVEWEKSTNELKANGWTWQDVNEMAKFIIKHDKRN
jgi:hypothetical protein